MRSLTIIFKSWLVTHEIILVSHTLFKTDYTRLQQGVSKCITPIKDKYYFMTFVF